LSPLNEVRPSSMNTIPALYSKLEFDCIRERVKTHASSDLGKQLVEEIIPFTDLVELTDELERVSECKLILETDDPPLLDGIKDVRASIQRAGIEDSCVSAPELHDILSTLRASRLLKQFLGKRKDRYPRLGQIGSVIHADRVLEYNIDQAVGESGSVKDSATKELREIRRAILLKSEELRARLEGILKRYSKKGYAQEEIVTTRDGRMVVPVKVEHKHHVPGFIHSSSSSGATVFIEPAETLEMNNEIRTLRFAEQREVERILRALTSQIRERKADLLPSIQALARLDFIFAKGKYSVEIMGSQPVISDQGPLVLLHARHPILLQKHNRDDVVPLDLELGKDFQTLIITGPNAGGKTVALKTVGLLSLMLNCGLHIPASPDSTFPFFKEIFIDIGDEQSIENDLSSFTSHLMNLKGILEKANGQSLVLVDEIGAGTDPTEGGALAAAVLSSLTAKRSFTIATTHHGGLKAFAHETLGFENGAMEFDQITLRPTYRFKSGIPGSSYAVEIAQRLGLPMPIIETARELLGSDRDTLERLLASVEQRSQELTAEHEESEKRNSRLAALIGEYESKIRSVEHQRKEQRAAALNEAKQIIDQANAIVESTVKEIRTQGGAREAVQQAKADIQTFNESLDSQMSDLADEPAHDISTEMIREGDWVKLRGHNELGQVISASDNGQSIVVEFGGVRIQVKRKDLVLAEQPSSSRLTPGFVPQEKTFKGEIDLRGMTGAEAVSALDKFLDDASMTSLYSLRIIHGKGTGALRKRITEYLKTDPRVRASRLGEWNEGGAGVTIISLHD
jgi:DNA mismatch repair protein MutS2